MWLLRCYRRVRARPTITRARTTRMSFNLFRYDVRVNHEVVLYRSRRLRCYAPSSRSTRSGGGKYCRIPFSACVLIGRPFVVLYARFTIYDFATRRRILVQRLLLFSATDNSLGNYRCVNELTNVLFIFIIKRKKLVTYNVLVLVNIDRTKKSEAIYVYI